MSELCVILDIGGRSAAITAADVQSVIELEEIHPVPRTPDFVIGLTAMRSQSLTVIDARRAIGLESDKACGERAAVVKVDNHLYALQVDNVHDVTEARSTARAVPGGLGKDWARVAHGMIETGAGPAILLNIEALIKGPTDRSG